MTRPSSPEDRAQVIFKKEVQARQGQEAMAQYQAELQATLDRTQRLRALRLARDNERTDAADPANKATGPTRRHPHDACG
jgi:hypothetical protein